MNCPKCGKPNADSASFCISCGTPLATRTISSDNTPRLKGSLSGSFSTSTSASSDNTPRLKGSLSGSFSTSTSAYCKNCGRKLRTAEKCPDCYAAGRMTGETERVVANKSSKTWLIAASIAAIVILVIGIASAIPKKFPAQYHPLRQMRVGLMLAILQITTVRIKKQQHIIIDLVLLATMYSAQDMTNLEMNMSSLQTKPSRHVVLK